MSEEIYNSTERVALILILYLFSFLASLFYFLFKVGSKSTSSIAFLVCLIYASSFVFLNLIAAVDFNYNNRKGFDKLMKFIYDFMKFFHILINFVVSLSLIYFTY